MECNRRTRIPISLEDLPESRLAGRESIISNTVFYKGYTNIFGP